MQLKENQAIQLELWTKGVQASKLPLPEQVAQFQEVDRAARIVRGEEWPPYRYNLGAMSAPLMQAVAKAYHKNRVTLACAIAGVAAERFRLAEGKFPDSLEQLTPRWLGTPPPDLYGPGTLKIRRLGSALVIHSPNLDLVEERDHPSRKKQGWERGKDYGFRLWEMANRRQAPAAPKVGKQTGRP